MKKQILYVYAIAALFLSACGGQEKQVAEADYPTLTITLADKELSLAYAATIRGRQHVDVRPQVSGCITQICIAEGAAVRKGQTLFIIDQVPYQAALATAEASVKSAEAALSTARMNTEAKEKLHERKVVSDFDLRTTRNAELEAEAALALVKAEEVNARNNLSYTVVKSPVDGVAGMIPYRVGALVSSSITDPLVTVSDDSEVYAYFSMSENKILDWLMSAPTLSAVIDSMPPVSLVLSNGATYGEQGRIDAISGTIDIKTGGVSVRAVYPNTRRLLRNGSAASVVVPVVRRNAIVIPQKATYELQNKVFAYKVVDGRAVSVPITVEEISDGKEYIVTDGLQPGDVIIAEGAGLVKEGAVVVNTPK